MKEMNVLRRESSRSGWVMLLMVLCGLVVGGFMGELLGNYLPILKYGYSIGVSAHEWNFHVLKLTLGLSLNINMFSVLGIALAIYLYRKL
jgi:predicted membrane chloride channel (bestrophin family)